MLRLWRERLDIALHGDRVSVVRPRRWFSRARAEEATIPYRGLHWGDWKSAIGALSQALGTGPGHADVGVTLAGDFARFQVVPWSAALQNRSEEKSYVTHLFKTAYGNVADDWEFAWSMPAYGRARIACAIDRALLADLEQALAGRGARLSSVQPYLSVAFGRCRPLIKAQSYWFVLAEGSRLTFCLAEDGDWKAVVAEKIERGPSTAAFLLSLQRVMLAHSGRSGLEVYVYAPDGADLDGAVAGVESGLPVRMLKPPAGNRAGDTAASALAAAGRW